MNLVNQLEEYLINSDKKGNHETPTGYCPNCWGIQEYDNQIRKLFKDEQIDVNNKVARHAFIKDFMVTHIDGIRLKKGINGLECPTCHTAIHEY